MGILSSLAILGYILGNLFKEDSIFAISLETDILFSFKNRKTL